MTAPQFVLVAGCNGAGKSTSAPGLLPREVPYINADEIAKALPDSETENPEIRAGRILLEEWRRLEAQRADFAVETTLASRSLASLIGRLQQAGYRFHLVFIWLASPDLAVARVAERVRRGGHNIPEETIRWRYVAGVRNFFDLYQTMADQWHVFENTQVGALTLVADGRGREVVQVYERSTWNQMLEVAKRS